VAGKRTVQDLPGPSDKKDVTSCLLPQPSTEAVTPGSILARLNRAERTLFGKLLGHWLRCPNSLLTRELASYDESAATTRTLTQLWWLTAVAAGVLASVVSLVGLAVPVVGALADVCWVGAGAAMVCALRRGFAAPDQLPANS
jgi:hypothetical protein